MRLDLYLHLADGQIRLALPGVFRWGLGLVAQKGHAMLEITLTNEQQVTLTAAPVTPAGHPIATDGPITFSVQTGTCTLVPVDGDAQSVHLVSGTDVGDSVILVQADADLGAGVVTIADTVTVHVEHAQAASLGLQLGTPELKP